NLHTAAEIGIDDFQAQRSPTGAYRTAPLRGLWSHTKGGFYHDGRFETLEDVVEHYNGHFGLGLSTNEKSDLVEFLTSLARSALPPARRGPRLRGGPEVQRRVIRMSFDISIGYEHCIFAVPLCSVPPARSTAACGSATMEPSSGRD